MANVAVPAALVKATTVRLSRCTGHTSAVFVYILFDVSAVGLILKGGGVEHAADGLAPLF